MNNFKKVISYLESKGFKPFSKTELDQIGTNYQQTLLQKKIPMYRSLLELPSKKISGTSLVIEIGGTNFYGAKVTINPEALVEKQIKEPLPKIIYQSADEFFQAIASYAKPLIKDKYDSLAIVYSFPGTAIKVKNGIDVKSTEDPTKVQIQGINNKLIGEGVVAALEKHSGHSFDLPLAVLNDSVAVLFADKSSVGGVVGTGFNLAVSTLDGIINTESGNFKLVTENFYSSLVDEASNNQGQQLAEKEISGRYLGEHFKYILSDLVNQQLLKTAIQNYTSEEISNILSGNNQQSDEDKILYLISEVLRDRSAKLVGTMVGTLLNTFAKNSQGLIEIPIEGSLFWGMPGYQDLAEQVAKERTKKNLQFVNIPNAGRIGAAVAALSLVK